MSTLPAKADISYRDRHLRFVSEVAEMGNLLA